MCKYCKPMFSDGTLHMPLVNEGAFSKDEEGVALELHSDERIHIMGNHEVEDLKSKELITYLKVLWWDKPNRVADHLAIEINFCPFCGRQF